MIGGDSSRSGAGKLISRTSWVTRAVTGSMRSSILTRDWACRAFEALALNLSTKACSRLRSNSCRLTCLASSISRVARCFSKDEYEPR
jgi:hypothetical protein